MGGQLARLVDDAGGHRGARGPGQRGEGDEHGLVGTLRDVDGIRDDDVGGAAEATWPAPVVVRFGGTSTQAPTDHAAKAQ